MLLTTELRGCYFINVRVWPLTTLDASWLASMNLLEPSRSKPCQIDDFEKVATRPVLQVLRHLLGCGWTNCLSFSMTGISSKTTCFHYAQRGSFLLVGIACRRTEELRAPRILLFWKRSISLSFLDIFFDLLLGLCFFVFWGLFSFPVIWSHPAFCILPVLFNLRIVDRLEPWRPNRAAPWNQRLSNYQNKSCKSYAFPSTA